MKENCLMNGHHNNLTIPEKILQAAMAINGENETFTAEDLIVSSWKLYPDVFGLQGYADKHPDSNKILSNIMGSKGLREKKWIRKVGEKKYRITEAGKEAYRNLANTNTESSHSAGLSREIKVILSKLLKTKALEKFKTGQQENLNFSDACMFWNISVRSNAALLESRLKDFEVALSVAENLMADSKQDKISLVHGEVSLSMDNIKELRCLHKFMYEKFSGQLAFISKRRDERKYS
jgi:hypothetical protein